MLRIALGKPNFGPAIGVYGGENPAAGLRTAGYEAVWHDSEVAFTGGAIGTDASGRVVVCGDVVLDNAAELRSRLERPAAADAHCHRRRLRHW